MSKKTPCERVTAVINNSQFTEDDREWLSTLEDGQLDKMIVKKVDPIVNVAEVSEDQIKKILSNNTDPVTFIDKFMPEGLKDQMKDGMNLYNQRRESLVTEIVANSKFTVENLASWSVEDLATMHKSVVKTIHIDNNEIIENGEVSLKMDDEAAIMLNLKTSE